MKMRTAYFLCHCGMVVLLACVWAGCSEEKIAGNEILRLPSPDRVVDAVLIERNVGATVSTPAEIYLVADGKSPTKSDLILRGDRHEGLSLEWSRPNHLNIRFSKLRIFSFTNFWQSKSVQNFSYVVDVHLKQEIQALK